MTRTTIEITDYVDGMLDEGGVRGRLVSYPTRCLAQALGWDRDDEETYGGEIISGCIKLHPAGVTLASWLDINYPEEARVVRRGKTIK